MEITVVGMGNMGRAFAKRAYSQGFEVLWWNRTRERVKDAPGRPIEKLAEARGLVAVFVSDDDALLAVVPDIGGDYVALCGTYSIQGVKRALEILTARGRRAFAMPVVGSPRNVENGDAIYIVGAHEEIYTKTRPILEKFGALFYIGDSIKAAALKLAFNTLLISTVAVLGEATTLAIKYGIKPDVFKELLSQTVFKEIAARYIDRMLGSAQPTFTLKNAAKDMRYASNAAGEAGAGNVAMSGVKALYEVLAALGYGEEDYVKAGIIEGK
ncbi:NAD(P)-dependent oxidoreductase [Pyrobaculum aerophilum]|nr:MULTISPECIES: NAD(P)-dependent oxidoreductase [Pyrobaculum]MCX8137259.1 NAD(P)-dependent oxidoreductase [Pyrobaculum aerophilum]RFA96697.1 3-hydroxyisobutyrate dehydrogenase [Pyrobaculum aerophilum]HII47425.1 NAD(P)-dependent oxidoreductase [Pyrobaculum aerophilum]